GPDPLRAEVGQPHQAEHAAHFRVPRRRLGPLLEQRDVVHEREGGEATREADLLRQVAELTSDVRAFGWHLRVQAQHAELSLAGRQRGGQQAEQRGLAGAVGTEQPDHAGFQVQVDAGQRAGGTERAPDVAQADRSGRDRYLRGRSWCSRRRRTRKTENEAAARARKAAWARAWSTASGELIRNASIQITASQRELTATAERSGLNQVDAARTTATKPTAGSSQANGSSVGMNSPESSTAGNASARTAIVRSRISRSIG